MLTCHGSAEQPVCHVIAVMAILCRVADLRRGVGRWGLAGVVADSYNGSLVQTEQRKSGRMQSHAIPYAIPHITVQYHVMPYQSSIKCWNAGTAFRAEQGSCEPISQLRAHA